MSKNEPLYQQSIINKLAKEYHLSPDKVREAVMYQFRFVRKIMTKGKFESVRLRYFGEFHVNPKRLQKLQERNGKEYKSKHSS